MDRSQIKSIKLNGIYASSPPGLFGHAATQTKEIFLASFQKFRVVDCAMNHDNGFLIHPFATSLQQN